MTRRTTIMLTATTLALGLALGGCQSTAGGSSSSGGSTGGIAGGGDTFDPAPGDLGWGQNNSESGPMKEADTTKDSRGKTGSYFTDEVDGCKYWFGVNPGRSSEYLVAADKYGIAGHVQWKCGVNSVERLHLHVKLRWALTPTGPWNDEPTGNANRTYDSDLASGTAIVFNDNCTTDYWQVGFQVNVEEASSGQIHREWVWSQWRKVTSEDCNRE